MPAGKKLLFFLLLCLPASGMSQDTSNGSILLKGVIYDAATYRDLPFSMVVNKNSSFGIFSDMQGRFSISVSQKDTILISARGYSTKKICFRDSVSKAVYEIEILMQKLVLNLKEVEVFPERRVEEIERDISRMEHYDQKEYMLSGINAIQSPITFLYQKYSRLEKSRRKVAELELEDAKREVVKELLRMYVKGNVILLEEKDFDDFITYCNVDVEFLKNCTQYEFILFVKKKYSDFLNLPLKNKR